MKKLLNFSRALLAILTLFPVFTMASDHADPISLKTLEPGITGLFTFSKGDDLVVILTIRRGLTSSPPYELDNLEYSIYFDLTSKVLHGNAENNARYGGTVKEPSNIAHDVAIRFRLNNQAELQTGYPMYDGKTTLSHYQMFPVVVGVYDDPFIFPPFFQKNIIAMAVSIPFSSFPANQKDWLIWATSADQDSGEQIDHVGRSNRSQLGRFDFINTLHPSKHVDAIHERSEEGMSIQRGLTHLMSHFLPVGSIAGLFEYVLQIRPYDLFPDVMIFSTRTEAGLGFPNGRRLTDDIAGLTCAQGDCVLQEVALINGDWPRAVVNDRPFSDKFPYLAEPWPETAEIIHNDHHELYLIVIIFALVLAYILWRRRKLKIEETPYVKPYRRG